MGLCVFRYPCFWLLLSSMQTTGHVLIKPLRMKSTQWHMSIACRFNSNITKAIWSMWFLRSLFCSLFVTLILKNFYQKPHESLSESNLINVVFLADLISNEQWTVMIVLRVFCHSDLCNNQLPRTYCYFHCNETPAILPQERSILLTIDCWRGTVHVP